jgi:hypothetical protein
MFSWFRDKNGPPLYPILKPADLPDFFAVARTSRCPVPVAPVKRAVIAFWSVF